MLNFSKRIDYGLIALTYMAKCEGKRLTAKEISTTFNIPVEVLGQILPKLAKNRLISSVPGPKGGYALEKPLSKISVMAVINAIEHPAMAKTSQPVSNPIRTLEKSIHGLLLDISLEQLSRYK